MRGMQEMLCEMGAMVGHLPLDILCGKWRRDAIGCVGANTFVLPESIDPAPNVPPFIVVPNSFPPTGVTDVGYQPIAAPFVKS